MTELTGPDMARLLDHLATAHQGDVGDLIASSKRGQAPPPPAPPVAPSPPAASPSLFAGPPQVDVEPQPWELPRWRTAAAPAMRAGAPIHLVDHAGVRCAASAAPSQPLVTTEDPSEVTCRGCALLATMPHVSPCATERDLWGRPPAPPPVEAKHPPWLAPVLAGAAVLAAGLLVAIILVASGGRGSSTPSSSGGSNAAPAITTGGSSGTAGGSTAPEVTSAPTVAPTTAVPTPLPCGKCRAKPDPLANCYGMEITPEQCPSHQLSGSSSSIVINNSNSQQQGQQQQQQQGAPAGAQAVGCGAQYTMCTYGGRPAFQIPTTSQAQAGCGQAGYIDHHKWTYVQDGYTSYCVDYGPA
jgi:hypothetical protein